MVATEFKSTKKRKAEAAEEPQPASFPPSVGLEMHSEDEDEDGDEGSISDDGEVDDFPEIDAGSDSEADEEPDEEDDEDESLDEEDDESESSASDDELHIFPKAKTIISGITGQPKRVYPEIEPDYDSDSSTEDVWRNLLLSRGTVC